MSPIPPMSTAHGAHATDEALLQASARDAQAFGRFYDRFETELLRFFLRATRRPEIAADLAAETFASALEGAAGFDPERGSARSWLFGIARHRLADTWEHGRVEDRARRRLGMEPVALTDEAIEQIEQLGAERGALSLLEELPAEQRTAVHGRVIEEREYAELAASLACSESVVRQRVSRGLRALRMRLERGA